MSTIYQMVVIFVKIVKKIIERKQAEMQKVYPGLKCFKEGVRQIPIENIPGVMERGWKPDTDKRSVTGEGVGEWGVSVRQQVLWYNKE